MTAATKLPDVTMTGDGGPVLVPGTYPTDKALPIVAGKLQTQHGAVPVAGQIMTAEGPVIIPARERESGDTETYRLGSLKVVEQDRNATTLAGPPNTGRWSEDQYQV